MVEAFAPGCTPCTRAIPHVGAPPPVRTGMPATPPPPAGIRTRGGCSYGGFGLLRYVLCRSTAPGAKRVCRQLRRRRLAFAPGAGAPTVGSGFSDIFCVGAPPPVRNGAAGSSAPLLCGRAGARPSQARSAGALQEVTWFAAPRATCAHASCAYHWPPASPETPQYLPPPECSSAAPSAASPTRTTAAHPPPATAPRRTAPRRPAAAAE